LALAADHGFATLDWMAPPVIDSPFAVWLSFVRRVLEAGRTPELRRLTDAHLGSWTASALARLAESTHLVEPSAIAAASPAKPVL
jgi:hypothetical protein